MGKAGRHKRGILPKRLRPRQLQKKSKPKPIKERMKDVQLMIYQLEYRRATLPKNGKQRTALVECYLTDRINQGRKILEDLKKKQEGKAKNGKKKSA